jgi:hypothetical protein
METGIPLVAKLPAHNCQLSWLCKQKVLRAVKSAEDHFPRCGHINFRTPPFPSVKQKLA